MKPIIAIAALIPLILAKPIAQLIPFPDQCSCESDIFCITLFPQSCQCDVLNANECFVSQLAQGLICPPPTISEPCLAAIADGEISFGGLDDPCNIFSVGSPAVPDCGLGLTCSSSDTAGTGEEEGDGYGTCQPIPSVGTSCQFGGRAEDICAPYLECGLAPGSSPCFNPNAPCPGQCRQPPPPFIPCGNYDGVWDFEEPVLDVLLPLDYPTSP